MSGGPTGQRRPPEPASAVGANEDRRSQNPVTADRQPQQQHPDFLLPGFEQAGRGPSPEAVLTLQRLVGNTTVTALLSRRHRVAQPSVGLQRTIWIYGSDGYWEKEKKDPEVLGVENMNRVRVPPSLPDQEAFEVSDTFDDTDPSLTVYHGRNAQTKGMPNKILGYQEISPEEDEMFRKGLSVGKLKLAKSLVAVKAGEKAARSGEIDAHLHRVLEDSFNVSLDMRRVDLFHLLETLVAGLSRLQNGLNDAVILISSARMRAYGVIDQPADCTGWVPRGFTETGGQSLPATGIQDLKPVSGEIHMKTGRLGNPSFVGDTIIHEAAHKYLGAWDYSYIGVQGSVGRGLDARVQQAMEADDTLDPATARTQVKAQYRDSAYAKLVQGVVSNGIEPVFPAGPVRGMKAKLTDDPAVIAARAVWDVVRTWGIGAGMPPNPEELDQAITTLLEMAGLPKGAKAELQKVRVDKEAYLAEHGNSLNVKGHEVLFALPTGFLLKNADSWTELALTAAGRT